MRPGIAYYSVFAHYPGKRQRRGIIGQSIGTVIINMINRL